MNSPRGPVRLLSQTLRQLGDELRAVAPPPELAARVRHGVRAAQALRSAGLAHPGGRKAGHGVRVWTGAGTLAALLLGSAVLMLRLPPSGPLSTPLTDDGLRLAGDFIPVAPAERWPRGSAAAWLVSTELQGERLSAMGLPYDPARAGAAVRAELLLHPSGEVLAVRVLN